MSLSAMIQAAKSGKISDFEAAFDQEMASRVVDTVDGIKADVGASVTIDGEVSTGDPDDDGE